MSQVETIPESYSSKEARTKRQPNGTMSANGGVVAGGSSHCSVEELLIRMGLKEYISVFILNGYEDLELFRDLEPADLDYLGILNVDHRGKILKAVQLLHDMDCKCD